MNRDGFCIAVDTREQLPYSWPGVPMVRKTLYLGDYSIIGFEHRIAVERKSHADFVSTVTRYHEKFFGSLDSVKVGQYWTEWTGEKVRLARPWRYAIVVEATAAALDSPMPWTRVTPATIHANLIKLACLGIPVWPAGSRARAAAWTFAFLTRAWEEVRGMHE